MVRKNEIGCSQGWKKDLWELRTAGHDPASPPPAPGSGSPALGADVAATVMRVTPLDEHHDTNASAGGDEDVVVGQQPIMRGFDRPRSIPTGGDEQSRALSRDAGEAIRRAHEVFREDAARQPRREELTAPLTNGERADPDGMRPTSNGTGVASDPGIRSEDEALEATSEDEGEPAGMRNVSDSDGAPAELDATSNSELDQPRGSASQLAARPSRWQVSASRTAEVDSPLDPVTRPTEGNDTSLYGSGLTMSSDEEPFLALESREKRTREQPASLARHRWPPRNAGDAALFPSRVSDRDKEDESSRPVSSPLASSAHENGAGAGETNAAGVGAQRREWHERWKTNSLLTGQDNRSTLVMDVQEDATRLSHRIADHDEIGSDHHDSDPAAVDPENERVANDSAPVTASSIERTERLETAGEVSGDLLTTSSSEDADQSTPDSRHAEDQFSGVPRVCMTCRDFRPAESGERGWCTNDWAFSHRTMVEADSRPCQSTIGSWWLPHEILWLGGIDVQRHGHPTPLIDTYLGEPKEHAARRRS